MQATPASSISLHLTSYRSTASSDAARPASGPATQAAKRERSQIIRAIIDAMPEDFRSVLILKYYENLSRTEMAAALDISEQAVKGRLVRASQYLEDELRRVTGSWT